MKNTKGITLIALIITIIVMLILVSVSINIAIKTGLFEQAGNATKKYRGEQEKESNLSKITVGGVEYDSVEDYIAKNNGTSQDVVKWIYVDNGDGIVEITGIDLRGKKSEKKTIIGNTNYGTITLKLSNDTLVIPNKIDGKNVTKVALAENIYDGMLESDDGWFTISGIKNLIFADGIEELGIQHIAFDEIETVYAPRDVKNLEQCSLGYLRGDVTINLSNKLESINDDIRYSCNGKYILNFPNGKNDSLNIPLNKWGAEKIIVNGNEVESTAWIFNEDSNGNIEITGLDLTNTIIQTGKNIEASDIYYAHLYFSSDFFKVPTKINGKDVVSFSFEDTIVPNILSTSLDIFDVHVIILPETLEKIGTFKFDAGNRTIAFPNMDTISFPNGKNENLTIPEDKWGASKVIVEGVEQ